MFVEQKLDNFRFSTLDCSHERSGSSECHRFQVSSSFQQILDDIQVSRFTGEMKSGPVEIVFGIQVRSVRYKTKSLFLQYNTMLYLFTKVKQE